MAASGNLKANHCREHNKTDQEVMQLMKVLWNMYIKISKYIQIIYCLLINIHFENEMFTLHGYFVYFSLF